MSPEEVFAAVDPAEGWFDLANVYGFSELELPGSPVIFECGTYKGRSAKAFSFLFPGAEIHTCDPVDEPGRDLPEGVAFYLSKGKDVEWDRPVDLLFLDDSHLYADIKENFEKFSPYVRPGGYVVFHDYHFPTAGGVKEFVDELGGCEIDPGGEYGLAIWRKPDE